MKLTRKQLKQLIQEELGSILLEQPPAPDTRVGSLGTGALSQAGFGSALTKQARSAVKGEAGAEFDPVEKKMVLQANNILTKIASAPGVELKKYKQLLVRALVTLAKQAGVDLEEEPEAEKEPAI